MTPRELSAMLARNSETVAQMLLPHGKRVGQEWRAGSINGEKGSSLGVHLTGDKAGVWKDFSSGEGGDLIDLWAATKGMSLADAIKDVKQYLGVQEPGFAGYQKKEYKQPAKPVCSRPQGNVRTYLAGERMLTAEAIAAYKIAASQNDDAIIFPYLRDGQLVNVKTLKLERNEKGKKVMRVEEGCEQILFGWQAVPDNQRIAYICEGEIDAITLWQYGYPALSVFSGAGNHAWVENEYERLERFDEIILCFDNDEPGQKGAKELAERLGIERCRLMHLPFKDVNDCLKMGVPQDGMDELVAEAVSMDPAELRTPVDYLDDIIREFHPDGSVEPGFDLPWDKARGRIKLRPGEVIVLGGVNGHGKSEAAGHITLGALMQNTRACIASLEFKPKKWLKRMYRQAAAMETPSPDYIRAIDRWVADKLWVFDVVGTAKADRILQVFTYARKRYGITLFIIDNLAKCGLDEDDYNGQKALVDRLTDFAKTHDSTVILVAHMRKGQNEDKPAGKMDIKGTGAITDMVDTVIVWWKNEKKLAELEELNKYSAEIPEELINKPDAAMMCVKQRNGDEQPHIGLWFDRASHQFIEGPKHRAHPYVKWSAKEDERVAI